MKIIIVITFSIFLIGCRQTQNPPSVEAQSEKPSEVVKTEKTPEISLDDLTAEQKERLDKSLPPKLRNFLDEAEELDVLVHLDKETKQQKVLRYETTANTIAKITDPTLKKEILKSFYFDTAAGYGAAACWSPAHQLKVVSKGKTFAVTICYSCNSYEGTSPFGKIGGNLNGMKSKSLILLDEAIEKYGVDMR